MSMKHIVNLADVTLKDHLLVGGKNASTGEMLNTLAKLGVKIPGGFATTTDAYKLFLAQHKLHAHIQTILSGCNIKKIKALNQASTKIKNLVLKTPFLPEFEAAVTAAYAKLNNATVAVRSSSTAEDLAYASFAGQQETFLNIKGIKPVLHAIKLVFASLFTSRAINYRHQYGL